MTIRCHSNIKALSIDSVADLSVLLRIFCVVVFSRFLGSLSRSHNLCNIDNMLSSHSTTTDFLFHFTRRGVDSIHSLENERKYPQTKDFVLRRVNANASALGELCGRNINMLLFLLARQSNSHLRADDPKGLPTDPHAPLEKRFRGSYLHLAS